MDSNTIREALYDFEDILYTLDKPSLWLKKLPNTPKDCDMQKYR